ncbi:hypothetical protein MMYC01_200482 [Madurella mycetomatis]|uniref:MARVEL domain-containing protein n=1 Tax=Madurella mycetomatis TaxID=100816 RepID=A0A175WHU7_9PEZI|nr:hypothetical protein MMYC01_200482 [Madurella mycetomatis]
MADASVPSGPHAAQYAAPTEVPTSEKERYIQQTPVWVVVLRGAQIFFSFIIVVLAGVLIHGKALEANGYAVACAVFTWIVVTYDLVTEKVASANGAYNIWAVLALDLSMAILWLASCGANAALRATFTVPVNVHGCVNDGSLINSNHCDVSHVKRADGPAVASDSGLAMMSAIAGLSALVWLLFVATLVFHGHTFRLWHQANKKPSDDNATVEGKIQGAPMLGPQPTAAPAYTQYSDQQQYPPQHPLQPELHGHQQQTASYPQQQPVQYQQPGVQPGAELPGHQGTQQPYATYPDPNQAYYSQQPYSPQGTPAPGQAYYPPPQSTVSALSTA